MIGLAPVQRFAGENCALPDACGCHRPANTCAESSVITPRQTRCQVSSRLPSTPPTAPVPTPPVTQPSPSSQLPHGPLPTCLTAHLIPPASSRRRGCWGTMLRTIKTAPWRSSPTPRRRRRRAGRWRWRPTALSTTRRQRGWPPVAVWGQGERACSFGGLVRVPWWWARVRGQRHVPPPSKPLCSP